MKLARVGEFGQETPVVVTDEGKFLDLRSVTSDITSDYLASGGIEQTRAAVEAGRLTEFDGQPRRYGPPIKRPGKVICIGLNYEDHAAESAMPVPTEPVVFFKASNTVVGPDDDVLIPRGGTKTDYEVELAVIIGKTVRYLESVDRALDYVAGYAISNDVSERAFQLERGGQWVKGKSCETFNPLGPWLVTADEVGAPQALGLRLAVNGELRQDGTAKDMVFEVPYLVHYLSQFMVLEPGDVINSGTPAGVAFGVGNDFPYLTEGDVMELEVDGLGRQKQTLHQA